MNRFIGGVVFLAGCLVSQLPAIAADPLGPFFFTNVDLRPDEQGVKYCRSTGTATFRSDGTVQLTGDGPELCRKYPSGGIETHSMGGTLFYTVDSGGVMIAESSDMQQAPIHFKVISKGCALVSDETVQDPKFLLSWAALVKESCVSGVADLPGPVLGKREIGVSRRITFGAGAPGWHVVGIGNFDGQRGTDDVAFLRNNLQGEVRLRLLDDKGGQISDVGVFPAGDPNWKVVGVGDFNGDGRMDLAWRRANNTGEIRIHLLNGSQRLADLGLPTPPKGWEFVGIGDFIGSGKSQILWRVAPDGPFQAWVPDIPAQ